MNERLWAFTKQLNEAALARYRYMLSERRADSYTWSRTIAIQSLIAQEIWTVLDHSIERPDVLPLVRFSLLELVNVSQGTFWLELTSPTLVSEVIFSVWGASLAYQSPDVQSDYPVVSIYLADAVLRELYDAETVLREHLLAAYFQWIGAHAPTQEELQTLVMSSRVVVMTDSAEILSALGKMHADLAVLGRAPALDVSLEQIGEVERTHKLPEAHVLRMPDRLNEVILEDLARDVSNQWQKVKNPAVGRFQRHSSFLRQVHASGVYESLASTVDGFSLIWSLYLRRGILSQRRVDAVTDYLRASIAIIQRAAFEDAGIRLSSREVYTLLEAIAHIDNRVSVDSLRSIIPKGSIRQQVTLKSVLNSGLILLLSENEISFTSEIVRRYLKSRRLASALAHPSITMYEKNTFAGLKEDERLDVVSMAVAIVSRIYSRVDRASDFLETMQSDSHQLTPSDAVLLGSSILEAGPNGVKTSTISTSLEAMHQVLIKLPTPMQEGEELTQVIRAILRQFYPGQFQGAPI